RCGGEQPEDAGTHDRGARRLVAGERFLEERDGFRRAADRERCPAFERRADRALIRETFLARDLGGALEVWDGELGLAAVEPNRRRGEVREVQAERMAEP